MYGTVISGLALEGSIIPLRLEVVSLGKKKRFKKIITACNDQSVLQIFFCLLRKWQYGVFSLQCDLISHLREGCSFCLHYRVLVCFLSMLMCCYFQCPALFSFCDSFLMKLSLGAAVLLIPFILLWLGSMVWHEFKPQNLEGDQQRSSVILASMLRKRYSSLCIAALVLVT